MWSVWSLFCDCGFLSFGPLMGKDKKLMEASWWERLWGKLGLVLMGGAMLSKSLIQFSIDGRGCVPSLLLDLRPKYGGGDENNGDLLQKVPCIHCCNECPRPCSGLLLTHASVRDSWTFTGKPGSIYFGVITPFSWVLVCTRFVWALWMCLVGMGFDSKCTCVCTYTYIHIYMCVCVCVCVK